MGTTAQQVRVAPSPVEMGQMELAQEPRPFGDPKEPPTSNSSVQCTYEIARDVLDSRQTTHGFLTLTLGRWMLPYIHLQAHTKLFFFPAPTLGTAMGLLSVCWWSSCLPGFR